MRQYAHSAFEHVKTSFQNHKKTIAISTISTVVLVGLSVGGVAIYAKVYDGRVYPNISVNGINLGGLTEEEAHRALEDRFQDMLEAGLYIQVANTDRQAVIDLRNSGATDPDLIYDLLSYDSDAGAKAAFLIGRTDKPLADHLYSVWLLVSPLRFDHGVTVLDAPINEAITHAFGDLETPSIPADYVIEEDDDVYTVAFVPGARGEELFYTTNNIRVDALDLDLNTWTIALSESGDDIQEAEALALTDEINAVLNVAPYTLTHTTEGRRTFEWDVTADDLVEWLAPKTAYDPENETTVVEIALTGEAFDAFFLELHDTIDVKAQNARFLIEDGRVQEFKGSLSGVSVSNEETTARLIEAFGTTDAVIEVAVQTVDPEITTGSVNNLGIEEIVGVGISNFGGSPGNRISNIKHGADKLNGLLIAPGETFSLVEALKPFTIADGWLPELVIKDDEIKPEVGGGACQFGTTLFRAVMNSGMEVVERRNHSLVVSYYDDPSNGNPGTDATIYDPAPDFKFKNDFEHYVLLTTEVDMDTRDMIFTFWGTSDGRDGSYTPPVVLSWSGYGATVEKETTNLAPGVRKCQAPHSGATTSFDYNVTYADGTTFTKNYTSVYRSLPQVCLVGVAAEGEEEPPVEPPIVEEPVVTEDELDVEDVAT